jgi:hypothetical protein
MAENLATAQLEGGGSTEQGNNASGEESGEENEEEDERSRRSGVPFSTCIQPKDLSADFNCSW